MATVPSRIGSPDRIAPRPLNLTIQTMIKYANMHLDGDLELRDSPFDYSLASLSRRSTGY